MRALLILGLVSTSLGLLGQLAMASTSWKTYSVGDHGFSVSLPATPQSRAISVPNGEGTLLVYEAFEPETRRTKYSVFVNEPERGIFESDSVEAFLTGHISSLMRAAESATLRFARRTTFQGQLALEYAYDHRLDGSPYVARGVTFMVDGGYMRMSMWHPKDESGADDDYERFKGSFALIPLEYGPVASDISLGRGVSFRPPRGWKQQPTQHQAQLARYTHLTRSMQVLVAGDPAYTCAAFERDVGNTGKLRQAVTVALGGQRMRKLTAFEDVPRYSIRLTTVQYCLNSRLGAAVLGASEEDSKFERWSKVFEGSAATLRVR